MASSGQMSLHAAEALTTGYAHDALGKALGDRWKVPGHLVDAISGHHSSLLTPENSGLSGVIATANRLVLHYHLYCGYERESEVAPVPPDLQAIEGLCGGIDHVLERAFSFIEGATGTPERWYAATG